jgi:type IV pilus assembly protein PilQ
MSKQRKNWTWLGLLALAMFFIPACQNGKTKPDKSARQKAPAKSETKLGGTNGIPPAPNSTNGTPISLGKYSAEHDEQFRDIFNLAAKNSWDEADVKVKELLQKNPQDASAQRLQEWITAQRIIYREKHIEDRIREIDSKNSNLNPGVIGLFKEDKDRGLPPRKDVRDAVQQIESVPYFPESFSKKIVQTNSLFDLDSPQGRMAKILEKEVSVHLDNVTLEAIIFNLGQAEGINFVADKALPAFKQNLSVNLQKVRLDEFLRYVARNFDVQFQVGNDLIWIVDAKDPKRLLEETRVFRLKHGFIMQAQFGTSDITRTTTQVATTITTMESQKINKFVNDGAPATPSIEGAIKAFYSGTKYLIDYERNLIVARGTREQLEVLEKIVEEFDRPLQQVLIEARFVTITEAGFLQLGATWDFGRNTAVGVAPEDFTGLGAFSAVNKNTFGPGLQKNWTNIFPKVLGNSQLNATLSALQQSGEGQMLSAPRLTVINNLPAMINDGQVQYYYEEYTVKQTIGQYYTASSLVPAGKPTKITAGASLHVLASIGGDGENILLALNPQVNTGIEMKPFVTTTEGTNIFELRLPQYRTQEMATRVVVKSGQTVVMGGVLEREQRTYVESVPVLSKIPWLGALFRKRTEINKPRYLLIFVTASLLNENGEMVIPAEDAAKLIPKKP